MTRADRASMDTSETAMLSGRTIATIGVGPVAPGSGPRTGSETSYGVRRIWQTYVSAGGVVRAELAANAAPAVVAPGQTHRATAENGTVPPPTDLGVGPTFILCLTEESVVLAPSAIGCG